MELNPFKRNSSLEKINTETENGIEVTPIETIKQTREKLTSFIKNIKDKFSSLEKELPTLKGILRLLSVLVLLEGGQLLAQDESQDQNIEDLFGGKNLSDVSISEISEKLKTFDETPVGPLIYSQKMNVDEKDNFKKEHTGKILTDTGMVGNVNVTTSQESIKKEEQDGDKAFNYKDYFSSKIILSADSSKEENQTEAEIKTKIAEGYTKEEAIANAIEQMVEETGVKVLDLSESKTLEETKTNVKEKFTKSFTSITYVSGSYTLKNLHIDKIAKSKKYKGYYEAKVSARKIIPRNKKTS